MGDNIYGNIPHEQLPLSREIVISDISRFMIINTYWDVYLTSYPASCFNLNICYVTNTYLNKTGFSKLPTTLSYVAEITLTFKSAYIIYKYNSFDVT